MPYITVGKENSGKIDLYCEDHGTGDARRPDPRLAALRCVWEKQYRPCWTPDTG